MGNEEDVEDEEEEEEVHLHEEQPLLPILRRPRVGVRVQQLGGKILLSHFFILNFGQI